MWLSPGNDKQQDSKNQLADTDPNKRKTIGANRIVHGQHANSVKRDDDVCKWTKKTTAENEAKKESGLA